MTFCYLQKISRSYPSTAKQNLKKKTKRVLSGGYDLQNLDLEGAASLYIVSGRWPTNFKRHKSLIHSIQYDH